MNQTSNNKTIAKNTFILYLRMGITMIVSLYTSRIVLDVLGIDDFGIYSIVGGVIVVFSFISNALNNSTQRYLTYELGANNLLKFNRVLNTSALSLLAISAILLLLLESFGIWFLMNKLVIDESRIFAANIIFQITIITFLININTTPYNSAIISYEKMEIYAYIGIFETSIKLLSVLILPLLTFDKLISYSILILCVTILTKLLTIYYCKKKLPGTKWHLILDRKLFFELFKFSGWSLLGNISIIALTQGINIILNLFYGVRLNAAYGIANQLSNSVYQFISNFQLAFAPQITKQYASGDKNLMKLVFISSRISFLLFFIIIVPVIISLKNLLGLWLKSVPLLADKLCLIILVVMLIDTISGPLWILISATGNIKNYQLIISIITLFNIVIVYLMLQFGASPTLALFSRIIVSIALLIARLLILKHQIKFNIRLFIRNVIFSLIAISIIVIILNIPIYLIEINNIFFSVILKTVISLCISIPVIFLFGINKNERALFKNLLLRKTKKTEEF